MRSVLYSSAAAAATLKIISKSLFLQRTWTSASMSLIRPYKVRLFEFTAYLYNEVLEEYLVLGLIIFLFVCNLVFSILVELLNEGVDSLHPLNACSILGGALLNLELDLVLCAASVELFGDALLLRCNIKISLLLELIIGGGFYRLGLVLTLPVNEL